MTDIVDYLKAEGLHKLPLNYSNEACRAVYDAIGKALNDRPIVFGIELEKEVKALGKSLNKGGDIYWGAVTSETSNPHLKRPRGFHRSKLNEELERIVREKEEWGDFELEFNICGISSIRGKGKSIKGSAIYYRDHEKMKEFLASHFTTRPVVVYTFGLDL